jgi:hypothetical protein
MRPNYPRLVIALTLAAGACARATTATTTTPTTTTPTTTTTTPPTSSGGQARTSAEATRTSSSLPAARSIIDRYVQAIGGREAVLRHQTIRSVGSFEMPAAGVKGELTVVQAQPNKMALTMTIPGMGQMLTGFDGTTGWSVNPMQGPRLLEGKELEQIREDAGPAATLRGPDRVRSAETVELTTMGGQPCYKVRIVSISGRESFDCYSPETGLLVGMTQRQESPMGTVEVTTLFSDWKEFGGLKTPTKLRQQMMGQEQILTIDRLEFDRPEDAKALELPEQVKPLVKPKG